MRRAFLGFTLTLMLVVPGADLAAQDDKPVVAVLRYDNNTGDDKYEHLGRALSSMMISDLSVLEDIRLVERDRLEELVAELDFQQSAYVDPESAQSIGMILGAEYVVAGAFVTAEPEMLLDTRIAKVETTEIVTTAEVRGESESLFDLQQRLADELVQGFGLVLTEEQRARLRAQQEANRIDDVETALKFSEALCLMDYGAYLDAIEVMNEVRDEAPGSAIVGATMRMVQDQVEEEAASRLRSEANRRIGGLLGRRGNSQPERRPRPTQC
ncbi:MAG: CsgG/HfaB family protein [Gemmatimonadota bacterium]